MIRTLRRTRCRWSAPRLVGHGVGREDQFVTLRDDPRRHREVIGHADRHALKERPTDRVDRAGRRDRVAALALGALEPAVEAPVAGLAGTGAGSLPRAAIVAGDAADSDPPAAGPAPGPIRR